MSVQRANTLTAGWASVSPAGVFSGAAVYPLLALLASVAGGPARAELLAVAPTPLDLPVRCALGVWTREGTPLTLDWAARCDPRLTGDPAIDRPLLDAWASTQAGAPVPPLPAATVGPANEDAVVLASAVAVTAGWRDPFTDGVMRPVAGPWAGHRLASLHRRGPDLSVLRVAATAAGPVTLLAVAGTADVDVILCTAAGGAPPGAVLAAATTAAGAATPATEGPAITSALVDADDAEPELVVKVPRFAVSAAHDLLAAADAFGLRTASASGTFPGIGPGGLRVGAAGQSTAAAFTAGGFGGFPATTAAPPPVVPVPHRASTTRRLRVTVRFDLPFGYLTIHRPTGLVVMAGWIDDPEHAR
ncbi:hypothetical protein ABT297_10780 [Dactylosporangium sp. NPDC000555]|uniref:hypothetical protein n=1 Tax=Dactylosporangium sp. NPDC000555 TaxID=3154260 RepID=UPI00331F9BB0